MLPYSEDEIKSYSEPDQVLTQHDWDDAWHVQNACNLSGVVYSLAAMIKKTREEAAKRSLGWEWANRHPIVMLFADKINSMCGCQSIGNDNPVWQAYNILEAKRK